MLFIDPAFLFLFLPIACAVFYTVGRRYGGTAGLGVILAASLIFYAPWGLFQSAVLALSVAINFLCATLLLGLPDTRARLRTAVHLTGQAINLIALVWFKYHIWQVLAPAGESAGGLTLMQAAIPAGISFYTFHQAAFLADAHGREASVVTFFGQLDGPRRIARAFVRYSAFVTFFPQLVIGPITYLREFQPQVDRAGFGRLKMTDLSVGLTLVAIGLFKKVVIADNLDAAVGPVFSAAENGVPIGAGVAWLGMLSFYAQLYFDFSGYSDMALGLARLFGIRYPINFFSPLKAVGIIDFYRRWHMTLTRVIARFLYTPLSISGTRVAVRRRLPKPLARAISQWLPLLINFEVIALWHGAHKTFLVFGVIHGLWYVAETEVRASKAWKRFRKKLSDPVRATLGRLLFFLPMCLTFALFRTETLTGFGNLLELLVGSGQQAISLGSLGFAGQAMILAAAFAIVFLAPNSVELLRRYRPGIMTYANPSYNHPRLAFAWRANLAWALFMAAITLCALLFIARQPPFLYQGF